LVHSCALVKLSIIINVVKRPYLQNPSTNLAEILPQLLPGKVYFSNIFKLIFMEPSKYWSWHVSKRRKYALCSCTTICSKRTV